jgi:SAM-dependent methyltransferase
VDPASFRAELLAVPWLERDAWLDRRLGLSELPDDGPALPRDGVPYLPSPVHALLRLAEWVELGPDDHVVDVGSGVGRAAIFLHWLTGATVTGLEVQPQLVSTHRGLIERHALTRVGVLEGDAVELLAAQRDATVFTFYCPFSGERLERSLSALRELARARPIRVGCIDLPLPSCSWLQPLHSDGELSVQRALWPQSPAAP